MAWTIPAVVTVGNTIASAQWNAQARDNISLTAPGIVTTQGDIIYGSGVRAITRLGKGTKYQILRINSGATALEWATYPPSAYVYNSASGQTVNTADTVLTFDHEEFDYDNMANLGTNNERLTCVTAALYWISSQIVYAATSHPVILKIAIYNSSNVLQHTITHVNGDFTGNNTTAQASNIYPLNVGDYIKLIAKTFVATTTITTGTRISCKLSAIMIAL